MTTLSADDERFITVGAGGERPAMTPFECTTCGNRVLVRKNGAAQTTVQWLERLRCPQLLEASVASERALIASCTVLNGAIDEAVLDGTIPIAAQAEIPQE